MRAAVVRAFDAPPQVQEFEEPTAQAGETIVSVTAAALSWLTLSRSSGQHYSANARPPFVAGVDGVGTTPAGQRVYFARPRPPFGALAERVPVPVDALVPLPEGLDDATAAAAALAGMASWVPLTRIAPVGPGGSVLINGATGAAGHAAVQAARFLGAAHVLVAGRDAAGLEALSVLGATRAIPHTDPWGAFQEALRAAARATSLSVVLDYLWGPSAEAILGALGGRDPPRGAARLRYVEVGAATGETVRLSGALLRGSGLELRGSGLGSLPDAELRAGIGEFFQAAASARFRFDSQVVPLAEIAERWGATGGSRRIVFTIA
ncbi:MAG TPA: zinc-binding alcohol dehydrogenase family protein [Thermoplasmata archaeon]|nr:zinc-binding alcohol dehydrogenase family protein [Thermoplasmata archaeon]